MKEDEMEKLAQLLFDKIMEKQEAADQEYHEQIQKLVSQGYTVSDIARNETDAFGLSQEERLVGELARLQTIMMIFEDKEEYEKALMIQKRIEIINIKLNNGSGKY